MFKFLKLESGYIVNLCNITYVSLNNKEITECNKNGKEIIFKYSIWLFNGSRIYATEQDIKKILSEDFYINRK